MTTIATSPSRGLASVAAEPAGAGCPGPGDDGLRDAGRTAPDRPRSSRRTRRAAAVSCGIVLASLLAVVGANASLTQGQVRLTNLQTQLGTASGTYRDLQWRVAQLENPSRVVSQAHADGLTAPDNVTDLPQVTVPAPTGHAATPAAAGGATTAAAGDHPTPTTASPAGR